MRGVHGMDKGNRVAVYLMALHSMNPTIASEHNRCCHHLAAERRSSRWLHVRQSNGGLPVEGSAARRSEWREWELIYNSGAGHNSASGVRIWMKGRKSQKQFENNPGPRKIYAWRRAWAKKREGGKSIRCIYRASEIENPNSPSPDQKAHDVLHRWIRHGLLLDQATRSEWKFRHGHIDIKDYGKCKHRASSLQFPLAAIPATNNKMPKDYVMPDGDGWSTCCPAHIRFEWRNVNYYPYTGWAAG